MPRQIKTRPTHIHLVEITITHPTKGLTRIITFGPYTDHPTAKRMLTAYVNKNPGGTYTIRIVSAAVSTQWQETTR